MSESRGLVDDVVRTLEATLPAERPIPLHAPEIGALEQEAMRACLESGFVSSVGKEVTELERLIAEYTGARFAVAVSNGTSALHVALVLAGVRPGDIVIVPALSFVATANAVAHAGATPYFVDSDERDLGMSADSIESVLSAMNVRDGALVDPQTGARIAAIVPMHTLGHAAQIERIASIAVAYGIPVVEDAAESLGTFVGDRHTGTFGLLGMISFNGNKIITTGGGGMILTDDPLLGARAKHLTTTAKLPHKWEFAHDEVAWNYRMPNLNAAFGVAQMSRLSDLLARKRRVADRYADAFDGMPGVEVVREPEGTRSNFWLNAIQLEGTLDDRDAILEQTNSRGIQTRPMWNLLSELPMYAGAPRGDLAIAERLVQSVICLPSSASLG